MTRIAEFLHLALWLIALLLVVWTLRQLPVQDMLAGIGLLAPGDWLLWILINVTILYLAVKRWQLLALSMGTALPLGFLFRLRQSASLISFVTPGPHFGGEPLQLYWLHKYRQLPLHRAIAVLGVDRFLETFINMAVLLAGVLTLFGTAILPIATWLQVATILMTVLLLMLVIVSVIVKHPAWLSLRLRKMGQRWRSDQQSDQNQGWQALVTLLRKSFSQQKPRLALAVGLALAGWGALLLELTLLLRFLDLAPTLTGVVLIMVGMRLAMLLPMPGGIGTIEASLLWSFAYLNLPLSAAAGLIVLTRLRDVVVLLIGLLCLAGLRRTETTGIQNPTTSEAGTIRIPID
ncbi:MAG: lysylphosphatidylglycerol synthase transmembrane domain-containing protein [Gammaproteobacteria bacterium]|nr:flippase-like domain-containing protein [Pseudomonadales bacterium]MCP5349257.1 flippase-like domain-containing protein [Pseudomonadales bacterium]